MSTIWKYNTCQDEYWWSIHAMLSEKNDLLSTLDRVTFDKNSLMKSKKKGNLMRAFAKYELWWFFVWICI